MIALLLLALLAPAVARELTVAQARELALQANPELLAARLAREQAELDVQAARGSFDPTLSVGLDASGGSQRSNSTVDGVDVVRSSDTTWSASLAQGLPVGGSVVAGVTAGAGSSNSQGEVLPSYATRGAWVSVSQPLLNGAGWTAGRAAVVRAVANADDATLELRQRTEELVIEVDAAYYQLLAAASAADLARRSRALAEQQLADVIERQAEGFAGSSDVLQVQRALGTARQAEVVSDDAVITAQRALARLCGLAGQGLVAVEPPEVPATAPELAASLALAREGNTAWLRASHASERASLEARLERNGALPDLSLSGSVGRSGLDADPDAALEQVLDGDAAWWAVGLDLGVALPARSDRAAWQSARVARALAEASLEGARLDLEDRVHAAVRAVGVDRSRVELATATLDAAERGLAADQERLRDGRGTTREVVQSLEARDAAELGLLQARIDLQASLVRLLREQGTLLVAAGLE